MKANKERLYNDVTFLTSLEPARNFQNIDSLDKAAAYIKEQYEFAGAKTEIQTWTACGYEYKNISTTYNSGNKRKLVVGAHYDVAGDQPGADDNASAVAGLLEMVRLIFKEQPQLDYEIDFVAYNLEEPPFFGSHSMGSYVHARSLHERKVDVLGMICLEMIGYFSDEPNSQPFPSPELSMLYPNTANFIIVVGIEKYKTFNNKVYKLMSADSAIDVQVIHFPDEHGLAGLSDQRSYWKFNFPALMINDTAFIRNPNYHTNHDTIDTLDFEKMIAVVDSVYKAIKEMD